MQQIESISPGTINQAVFIIALRYRVIHKSLLYPETYINSDPRYKFMPRIIEMNNLTKTIEDSGGRSANTNKEYFKLLHEFVVELAKVKQMSADAIYEVIFTEVNSIQKNIADNLLRTKREEKQFEETAKLFLKGIPVIFIIIFLFIGISAGVNTLRQRVLNTEEVERLRIENAQLQEENRQLKAVAKNFDNFKKERSQFEKLKARNENLTQKNNELNDRIIQCKKPFWERVCN